jgi:hypothetical protein
MGNGQLMSILYDESPKASFSEDKEQLERIYYACKRGSIDDAPPLLSRANERAIGEVAEIRPRLAGNGGKARAETGKPAWSSLANQEKLVELSLSEEQVWHLIGTQYPNDVRAQAAAFYSITVQGGSVAVLQERVMLSFHDGQKRFIARMNWYEQPVIQRFLAAQDAMAKAAT